MYRRIDAMTDTDAVVNVEVSFMEIYNENVFDLLNPGGNKSGLKVRNHPTTGPYVEDLSRLAVKDYPQIEQLMDEGSKARTVASTNMNATSSRSHAVFTIVLTITKEKSGRSMVSKIHMVDLAGSERATATGASGQRLKEGANINKSLSTLGKVIAALAKKSDGKKNTFVPYRDSVLTWLLKESLGGNSKTIMLAALSPADINFEETLSTLRYADSAKQIKNAAVVNEDPTEKLIRELQEEVERLRQLLAEKEKENLSFKTNFDLQSISPRPDDVKDADSLQSDSNGTSLHLNLPIDDSNRSSNGAGTTKNSNFDSTPSSSDSIAEIKSQIAQSTKLITTLNKSWETKLAETDQLQRERNEIFQNQGLLPASSMMDVNLPNLVNLNEDPLLSGSLIYYLRRGETRVGALPKRNLNSSSKEISSGASTPMSSPRFGSILLGGLGVASEHCSIVYEAHGSEEVWIYPKIEAPTFVNGIRLTAARKLVHGCRVIIGTNHIFRFNHPEAASRRADGDGSPRSGAEISTKSGNDSKKGDSAENSLRPGSSSSTGTLKPIDYKFALEERASAEIDALVANTLHFDLTSEEEKILEKQMKEYYEAKQIELDEINKQLENLKKTKDSVFDAIDYEQSRQELSARKMSIDMELSKQKEKFAQFSFKVWNEKLERQQLREKIAKMLILVEEANAISKELDKRVSYELVLRSAHPTTCAAEDLFESGFGLYKRMIVEVRGIDLRDGRHFDWSHIAFQELMEELHALYADYLTADDDEIEKFIGPDPILASNTSEDNELSSDDITGHRTSSSSAFGIDAPSTAAVIPISNSPFAIPAQEDSLRMFTHVTLRDLLYLNHTSFAIPVLDTFGKVCGQLHVELDRIAGETQDISDENNSTANVNHGTVDQLVGKEIEIALRINKMTGLDLPMPPLYCAYTFWNSSTYKTEIGTLSNDADSSSSETGGATLNFFHEERFVVSDVPESFLEYLENEPLVIELWSVDGVGRSAIDDRNLSLQKSNIEALRESYAASQERGVVFEEGSDKVYGVSKGEDAPQQHQEEKEDKFKMLASILIQESTASPKHSDPDYKNVMTKQEPWNAAATVQFRLKKHVKTPRKIVFQTAQLRGHPIFIEKCDQVTLTVSSSLISGKGANAGALNSFAPLSSIRERESTSPLLTGSMSSSSSATSAANMHANQNNNANTIQLKVLSVQDDRIECELQESHLTPLVANTSAQPGSNSSTPRRRSRSSAPTPVHAPIPIDFGVKNSGSSESLDIKPDSQRKEVPSQTPNVVVHGASNEGAPSEQILCEISFSLKLDRVLAPVRISKTFSVKFVGADRVKTLNRTVSEVQMIEDLKMKEVMKTQEEQLAMSGAHLQVTLWQSRTIVKDVSAKIEEQKFLQKLVFAQLLHERLLNELALVDKLSTLQTLRGLAKQIGSGADDEPSSNSEKSNKAQLNEVEAAPFVFIKHPRSKEDIMKRIELAKERIHELSAVFNSEKFSDENSPNVKVQVSVTDVNHRVESKVCGILLKKAGKVWKARWCVLSKLYLTVYRTEEEDETPKEILDLTNARVNDTSSTRYEHSFAIVNWKNVWFFKTQNAEDYKRWMDALDPERILRDTQATKEKSLQQKIESMATKLKEISENQKATSALLTEANDTIETREDEIVVLTNEVEKLNDQVKALEEEMENLKNLEESPKTRSEDDEERALDIAEKEEEIKDLKSKIEDLKLTIEELEIEVSELKEKSNDSSAKDDSMEDELLLLKEETESLRSKLKSKESEIEEAEDVKNSLENEISSLKSTIARMKSDIDETDAQMEEGTNAMELQLSKQRERYEAQITEFEELVESRDKALKQVRKELDQKDNELQQLIAELEIAKKSEEDANAKIDEIRKSLNSASEQLSDAQSTISLKDRELSRKEKDLSSKIEDIEELEKQVSKYREAARSASSAASAASESDISASRAKRTTKSPADRAEVVELKASISRLKEEMSRKDSELRSLDSSQAKAIKDATAELKANIEMHKFDLEEKEREIKKIGALLSKKEQRVTSLESELEASEETIEELKSSVSAKEKTISAKQKEIEKIEKQLQALKQSSSMSSNEDAASVAIAYAKKRMQADASEGQKASGSEDEISNARREAQMTRLRTQSSRLQAEVEELSKVNAELKRTLKETKARVSSISKDLSRKEVQLQLKTRHVDEMTKKVSDIEKENYDRERETWEARRTISLKEKEIYELESQMEDWKAKLEAAKYTTEDVQRALDEKKMECEENENEFENLELEFQRTERELRDTAMHVQRLEDTCFELQDRLQSAKDELRDKENDEIFRKTVDSRAAKSMQSQMQQEISERREDLERAEKEISKLQKEIEKKNRKIDEMESKLDSIIRKNDASKNSDVAPEIEKLKHLISMKDKASERLEDEIKELQRELKREKRRQESAQSLALATKSSELISSPSSTRRRRNQASGASNDDDEDHSSYTGSADERLKAKLEESTKTIVKLETELSRKNTQIERLERDRASQKSVLEELEASVKQNSRASASTTTSRRSEETTRLGEELDDLKKEFKKSERAHKNEIMEKNSELERLQKRLEHAQQALKSRDMTDRRAAIASLAEEEELEKLRRERSKPSTSTGSSDSKPNSEIEREANDLRERVIDLQRELREKNSEIMELTASSRSGGSLDSSVKRLEDKLEKQKQEMAEERRGWEQKRSKFESEISRLQSRLASRTPSSSVADDADSTPVDWKFRCKQAEKELEEIRRSPASRSQSPATSSRIALYPDIHSRVLKGEMELLREATDSKTGKIAELRASHRDLQAERAALMSETLDLMREKSHATSTSANKERQNARLAEQCSALESRLEETSRSERALKKQNDQLLDERIQLVLAIKKAQIEVLAATGQRLQVSLPSDLLV